MEADPWEVIGVSDAATAAEARRAYVARARLLHPDSHPGASEAVLARAQEAMSDLNEAWRTVEVLLQAPRPSPSEPPSVDGSERLVLERNLAAADSALDLVQATRQLRAAAVQNLLRSYERSRFTLLTSRLEEMLRHAEGRRARARKAVLDAQTSRDRSGSKRRLVRHHRSALRVHELAVECHQRILLAAPVDPLVAEMETILAELRVVPDDRR